jgi:RNA polymerase sigma factor (sigma-70 family)
MSAEELEFQEIARKIRASAAEREEVVRRFAGDKKLREDIRAFVLQNKGNPDDGVMIFHDSIIAFVKRVFTDRDFQLTHSYRPYIFGIAKNLWLTQLKNNARLSLAHSTDRILEQVQEENLDLNLFKNERLELIRKILDILKPNCRDVLMYWAGGYSMQEIADILGFPSEGAVRKKKYDCYKGLMEWLSQHPQFLEELKN